MGWRTVVVSRHSKLSLSMGQMIVQTDSEINQIPLDDIQVLLVETTSAVITTALLARLAELQIATIFSDTSAEPVCNITPLNPGARTLDRLVTQFRWPDSRVETLWTRIIQAKLDAQAQVVDFVGGNSDRIINYMSELEMNDATNREALAAQYYFKELFGKGFSRNEEDGTNAALNYGYAILLALTNREIAANGYLTQIGIHHYSQQNSFNLGSDLMEPFRPVYDQWISQQHFSELLPEIKYLLVDVLNVEIMFNGRKELLRNAIGKHVNRCLAYLAGDIDKVRIEVKIPNEVSSNEINDHV